MKIRMNLEKKLDMKWVNEPDTSDISFTDRARKSIDERVAAAVETLVNDPERKDAWGGCAGGGCDGRWLIHVERVRGSECFSVTICAVIADAIVDVT